MEKVIDLTTDSDGHGSKTVPPVFRNKSKLPVRNHPTLSGRRARLITVNDSDESASSERSIDILPEIPSTSRAASRRRMFVTGNGPPLATPKIGSSPMTAPLLPIGKVGPLSTSGSSKQANSNQIKPAERSHMPKTAPYKSRPVSNKSKTSAANAALPSLAKTSLLKTPNLLRQVMPDRTSVDQPPPAVHLSIRTSKGAHISSTSHAFNKQVTTKDIQSSPSSHTAVAMQADRRAAMPGPVGSNEHSNSGSSSPDAVKGSRERVAASRRHRRLRQTYGSEMADGAPAVAPLPDPSHSSDDGAVERPTSIRRALRAKISRPIIPESPDLSGTKSSTTVAKGSMPLLSLTMVETIFKKHIKFMDEDHEHFTKVENWHIIDVL